jgi:anti-anti-sigma factor
MPAEFTVASAEGVVVVTGEVDLATAPRLHEELDSVGDRPDLVVDLCAVTFLDSSGVAALYDQVRIGRRLELVVSADSMVADLLRITGLTEAAVVRRIAPDTVDQSRSL